MLTVATTHIKKGYIQRNGVDVSDQATLNEYFFRFGEGAATAILLLLGLVVVAIGYLWLSQREEVSV